MNILLLSMPDSFEHMPVVAIRMPNGALSSLAGNVNAHHRVAVADLILVQREVRQTVERLMREWAPEIVGLSVMTFQRKTAMRIIALVRALKPEVKARTLSARGVAKSRLLSAQRHQDAGAHFPRLQTAHIPGLRKRTSGVSEVPRDTCRRARICLGVRLAKQH